MAPLPPNGRPVVIVVNYPLQYFAQRIGGDLIEVRFPVPEGQDPAYWEPSGSQIAEIQLADLVLLNGADYAKWTLRATLPWSRTVVTCDAIADELIEIPDAVVHSHGPEGEHSHAGLVAETWLNPDLAIQQAQAIHDALGEILPDHATEFKTKLMALQRDLNAVAEELDAVFESTSIEQTSLRWLSAKPRFHYMLARYKIDPEVLHWMPQRRSMPRSGNHSRADSPENQPSCCGLNPRCNRRMNVLSRREYNTLCSTLALDHRPKATFCH